MWSPDGMYFAHASNRDGDYEVYITMPDVQLSINLTIAGSSETWPQLQPAVP